ncbi:MAG TPA: fatty acid desaturase [Steroidobacteraceae bacterium]|nr:fatty acid desaturase [Steroidobacteraceae bacterium]
MTELFPYGLFELSFWGYVAVTFTTIQVMFLGVTLYLHRDQSHGGLALHPSLRHLFRFWLWFSSGVVTKEWVAVHRRHHAYADQPGDPHSPVIFGLKRVVLEGYELYSAAARDPLILKNYAKGTPDDWIERHLYSRHPNLGIVLFAATMLLLFGIPAIVMVAVHLIAQPFFAGGVVNGLGHAVGYRSFEMPSTATNLVPWGLLLGGEELHNNHHAFPRSARFAVQRWEFDMGWLWICVFRLAGLAKVRYVAPRPHLERRRSELDANTVIALFKNRMHVQREYARRVVLPVCRELARREPRGCVPAMTAKLLIRHPTLLAEEARRALRELLERYEVLRRVVEYRESLQHLWSDASANQARAVHQLREWCARAEASGIRALREFSRELAAYTAAS